MNTYQKELVELYEKTYEEYVASRGNVSLAIYDEMSFREERLAEMMIDENLNYQMQEIVERINAKYPDE